MERAARARVSVAWMRWRELTALLCNSSIPICHRARVYEACIRSTMLYASETWAVTCRVEDVLVKCDRRMLRRMCGVQLTDRVATEELLRRCGIVAVEVMLRRRRLKWFGHVERRGVEDPLGRVQLVEAPGRRPRGRPKKTWRSTVEEDLVNYGLTADSAADRGEWSAVINRLTS